MMVFVIVRMMIQLKVVSIDDILRLYEQILYSYELQ